MGRPEPGETNTCSKQRVAGPEPPKLLVGLSPCRKTYTNTGAGPHAHNVSMIGGHPLQTVGKALANNRGAMPWINVSVRYAK